MAIPFAAAALSAARVAGRKLIKNAPKIYKAAKKKYKKSVGERGLLFKDGAIDRSIKRGAGKVYSSLTKVQQKGTKFTTKKGKKKFYTKKGNETTHAPTIKKYKKKNQEFVKGKTGGYKHDIIRTKKETQMAKTAGYAKTGVKLIGMSSLYGGVSGRISSGSQKRKNKQRRKGM